MLLSVKGGGQKRRNEAGEALRNVLVVGGRVVGAPQAATLAGAGVSAGRPGRHSCHSRQMARTRCRLRARSASRRLLPSAARRAR